MSNYPPGMRESDIPGIDDEDITVSVWVRYEMIVSRDPHVDEEENMRWIKEQILDELIDRPEEIGDIDVI